MMIEVKTKSRGLYLEDKLLNEIRPKLDDVGNIKQDDIFAGMESKIGQNLRTEIDLPDLSEPEVVRHFTRLSQKNYAIDTVFYPLGSCTMKHNPRMNEKLARLPGLNQIHPYQDKSTVQGALQLMYELQFWLSELSGLPFISLNPAAGAHGELVGMMIIKKAHAVECEERKYVLIPDSAHGTNPATAVMCGYKTITIASDEAGLCDIDKLQEVIDKYGRDIAAIMLTNPNTCGKFEVNVQKIADLIHGVGGYFYCDGANFNAIVGKVKPIDFGVDVMHFNLHKTFSTPHGGGGPGSGPIGVCRKLAKFLPVPYVKKGEDGIFDIVEEDENSIGCIKGFYGQFGMFVRALAYMLSYGKDGLKQVAEDAVLNANYILVKLKEAYHVPYKGYCMHECLLTDKYQQDKASVSTNDIAKTLIEYGIHPMTVYFPLVVKGAMLIEPTETESKDSLDNFIEVMEMIAEKVTKNEVEDILSNPQATPVTKPDEYKAAREPTLTWND